MTLQNKWLPVIRSKMRCVLSGLMYETASKRVYKSKRCVLFMTFRPSQRTLFMARRNWVPLALTLVVMDVTLLRRYRTSQERQKMTSKQNG